VADREHQHGELKRLHLVQVFVGLRVWRERRALHREQHRSGEQRLRVEQDEPLGRHRYVDAHSPVLGAQPRVQGG